MITTYLPSQISFTFAGVFAASIFTLILAEGNSLSCALSVAGLILVGTVGFNANRGLQSPVGAYILFVILFTGLLGAVVKVVLNERFLTNVENADETLWIYFAGTCTMVIAASASKHLAKRIPILSGRLTHSNVNQAVMGALIFGVGLPLFLYAFTPALATIARQLNVTVPFAILIGVFQRVRSTKGRSSFTWPTFLAWIYSTQFGLLSYSKESMFAPSLAWIIASMAARLKVTTLQVIAVSCTGVLAVAILVPYSQYGRQFRVETANDWRVAYKLLKHPLDVRERYQRDVASAPESIGYHWFDHPQGILDRLTELPIDSALIRRTDALEPIGITNTFKYVENIVPHFILPDKPEVKPGNEYAHEIGMLASSDVTTGISFSPYADAYHQAGWLGVLVLQPLVLLALFTALRSVVGDVNDGPWCLFFIAAFAHLASEGLLVLPFYIMSVGMEASLATAFVMLYVTPIMGSLILGPSQRQKSLFPKGEFLNRRSQKTFS